MSDADIIRERTAQDEKKFMIDALSLQKAPRIAPAAMTIRATLADGQWHSFESLMAAALLRSDLAVKTVAGLLHRAVRAGVVERRGEYRRPTGKTPAQDNRELRLLDWPEA